MVLQVFNLSTQKVVEGDLYEFKASQGYIVRPFYWMYILGNSIGFDFAYIAEQLN